MRNKQFIFFLLFSAMGFSVHAQELKAKVTVLATRVNSTVDKKIFTTLQAQLNNLMNNRKWTSDVFGQQEKIECSFIINIESAVEPNLYKASLTIQAARPVFNASYQSAMVNFIDPELLFKYVEFQPVEFNEKRDFYYCHKGIRLGMVSICVHPCVGAFTCSHTLLH